jgi:type I restriction enzyme R subunit
LQAEARNRAQEEGLEHLEELFRNLVKRSHQSNLSFFAFTATPKHETLKFFGRQGEPFHRYTMRQAIEEGFILDILRNYTTYKVYYNLIKATNNDPNVERKNAARSLARFMRLHPHNIAQKTEIMVEHFNTFTRHKIGGRAKAMVVTSSRLEAVRYKQSFDKYIKEKGYPIKTLVAFSGVVTDDKIQDKTYSEEEMNQGIREKELPEQFASNEYQVLLVAEKYQTGFDQPLLHTMYIDRFFDQIVETAANSDELQQAARVNSADKFGLLFNQMLESLFVERVDQNEAIFARYMNDRDFQKVVADWLVGEVYKRIINSK